MNDQPTTRRRRTQRRSQRRRTILLALGAALLVLLGVIAFLLLGHREGAELPSQPTATPTAMAAEQATSAPTATVALQIDPNAGERVTPPLPL